ETHALGQVVAAELDVVIVPARALFTRLPPPEAFASRIVRMQQGADLDPRAVMQTLVENGFVRTDLVGEAGEFAFRGGILDVFPPASSQPVRVELFGDTVDSLRWFDIETQRSGDASGPVTIHPITPFPITRETRNAIAKRLSLDFMDPLFKRDIAEKIEKMQENSMFPGIEHYAPVAVPSATLADYIADWDLVLIEPDQIATTLSKYETLLRNEYDAAAEKGRAVYPPEKLVAPPAEILQ